MSGTPAIILGSTVILWQSLVIAAGILGAVAVSAAAYRAMEKNDGAIWVFFPFAIVFSFVISRLTHWYFNKEQYASVFGQTAFQTLKNAFSDFSIGSYCLPGVILGVLLAALAVSLVNRSVDRGAILDAAAPGVCVAVAFIRLSSKFTLNCIGKSPIENRLIRSLPLCVELTDGAGGVTYRLAVFFIEFLLLAAVLFVVLRLLSKRKSTVYVENCSDSGNVWRIFLVFFSVVEVIMDSLRTDSPLMHFSYLTMLNKYSAFISFAQVCAVVFLLAVFVYYLRCSSKTYGFGVKHIVSIVVFVAALVGVGYFGEYSIQRYGTITRGYIVMAVSLAVIAALICRLCRECVETEKDYVSGEDY